MDHLDLLIVKIAEQYKLDPQGVHGLSHWARVLENGQRLAENEGGDTLVIQLFAIFHDACRLNQTLDPGHGARGAALAEDLLGNLTLVTKEQLDLLTMACIEHTDGKTTADLTIQICWDSDRLDLARAGIYPNPKYLCTETARTQDLIDWANQRALSEFSPTYVDQNWIPLFDVQQLDS